LANNNQSVSNKKHPALKKLLLINDLPPLVHNPKEPTPTKKRHNNSPQENNLYHAAKRLMLTLPNNKGSSSWSFVVFSVVWEPLFQVVLTEKVAIVQLLGSVFYRILHHVFALGGFGLFYMV